MEKKISTNQTALLFIIFTIGLKLSVLPAIMNDFAGTSSYVSCLIALVIDFLCTLLVISIMIKIPNMSFYELVEKTMHRVIATIAYILLFVYFFVKMTIQILCPFLKYYLKGFFFF